jgi:glycosyltransferase involved in cell wall biosynthesis
LKLLFVVQRYGAEVFGGAELHAREMAVRLAARGHDVEVVTSCGVDYTDWANVYAPGESLVDGVRVHRLPVARPRVKSLFDAINGRALGRPWRLAPHLQREWMRLQGPFIPELTNWIAERSRGFDVTIFFTYLYYTTWAGLPAAASPAVLHPTAHDEPPIYLALFDAVFRLADAFAFSTEEEAAFVRRRFRVVRPSRVVGIGIELDTAGDPARFRERFGLGDRPYLVCVGRIDPSKGSHELYDHFTRYCGRHRNPPALVFVGEEVVELPEHRDVLKTGFVDDATRNAAIKGADLLIQPSYFESFSLVLCEAWAQGVPALVQALSPVLLGQSIRSGAGVPYRDYPGFEVALERLLADPQLRRRLGEAGRAYVESRYRWPTVLSKYESFLEELLRRPVPAAARAGC